MSDQIEMLPVRLPNREAKAQALNCEGKGSHVHVKMPVFI